MKRFQAFALVLVSMLLAYSANLRAEDIDVYVSNNANVGTPNVLFVIDNSADFSSNDPNMNCTFSDGTVPSMQNTAGGVEQCGLIAVLSGLRDSSVNIGIMMGNANGFATDTRATTDAAYHEVCQGTYGGCLLRKLTLMNSANKTSLMNFIKSWVTSGQNSATQINVKSSTGRTANMMQEAWAYFNGKIGMSGTNYATSILANGCQKNFIVFIGNSASASGGPADGGSESPYNGTNALTSTQVGANATQLTKITSKVTFSSSTCGVTSRTAGSSASDWSENWADEWARLMYQKDGGATGNFNTQNVVTYTIGLVDEQKNCSSDYPALLSSMATYGNGKYFKATSAADLKTAFDTILNEVQAVNSVFSAASLPVSVNAQGLYLNQIYLGMFRPDDKASPRWRGNLKQYQFAYDNSGNLVLAGADGKAAISSSGTGFLSPTAQSFWTSKNTSTLPDSVGGFFVQDTSAQGTVGSGYDLPGTISGTWFGDGEVVEKGGTAQQIRKESLTATFTGSSNTTSNPRRLYTYCPAGSSCNPDLTNSGNDFSTANSSIDTAAFGSSTAVKISTIARTGTTALVTTSGAHGFSTGNTVTISNASPSDYNVTQAVTVNSSTTFTITGLNDYPTTPSQGTYFITTGGTPVSISSIVRSASSTSTSNTETVTVTTSAAHGFTTASNILVSGATPSNYNYTGTPASVPSSTTFTYSVAVTPTATAANSYQMVLSPSAYSAKTVTLTNASTGEIDGSTSTAHGLHVGQSVTIVGATSNSKYSGTYTIATVPTTTTFTITGAGNNVKNLSSETGTFALNTSTAVPITTLGRTGTTDTAKATATGLTSNWFGSAQGDTAIVNVTKKTGNAANETEYVLSNVTVTCQNVGCTTVTFPISVNPSSTITLNLATASLVGSKSATVAAGAITRTAATPSTSSATATISGVGSTFATGDVVTITPTGTAYSAESAYLGQWTLTCSGSNCTFGNVTLSPSTNASGAYMQAYNANVGPDRDTVIKWVRGMDNYGDELGPCYGSTSTTCTVSVRPSVHGDVLHSRPLVLNYGTSTGIVVYYGSNDGVFHAVNGNQTASISSVPAGDELWGLVLPEHFTLLNRQRTANPELKFPTTTLATATTKDYFVDGPIGALTKLDSTNTSIATAYIYLSMRRGGRFLYGLDVSNPTTPKVLFKKTTADTGMSELGQTWSIPQTTYLERDSSFSTPVIVFGGGYDPSEDTEPPGTDTMGRGIFVLDATTGAVIWSANSTCTTSSTCLNVPGMTYAIPTDLALIDRNANGRVDKLYFGDVGGNVWRADIADSDTTKWKVTKLAALGCDTGACSSGTAPRKFFYPPAVIVTKSFDAVSIVSGDREHPLKNTATGSSYLVNDKFFMIMDQTVTVNPTSIVTSGVTLTNLSAITTSNPQWTPGTNNGFYITFQTGEKGVNAPLGLNGTVFFGTNRPADPSATCIANLGTARAWAVNPFTGASLSHVLDGGGLAPSAVAGIVTVTKSDGSTTEERFCIGCGVGDRPGGSDGNTGCNDALETCSSTGGSGSGGKYFCNSFLNDCPSNANISSTMKRTYWYKK
jgi:Tfp pilus tip-associated adhesin PilY1